MHTKYNRMLSRVVLIAIFMAIAASATSCRSREEPVKSVFERKYEEWVEYRAESGFTGADIDPTVYFDDASFKEIVGLGVKALPCIIAKQQDDHMLGYAAYQITKLKVHTQREGNEPQDWVWTVEEFPDIQQKGGPPDSRALWMRWWTEGRRMTDYRFEMLYEQRSRLKAQKQEEKAKITYQLMIDLGIAALPNMMEKVKTGDNEIVAAVSDLVDGAIEKDASKDDCLKWWEANQEAWKIPFPKRR